MVSPAVTIYENIIKGKSDHALVLNRKSSIIYPSKHLRAWVLFYRQFELIQSHLGDHVYATSIVDDEIESFSLMFDSIVEDVVS